MSYPNTAPGDTLTGAAVEAVLDDWATRSATYDNSRLDPNARFDAQAFVQNASVMHIDACCYGDSLTAPTPTPRIFGKVVTFEARIDLKVDDVDNFTDFAVLGAPSPTEFDGQFKVYRRYGTGTNGVGRQVDWILCSVGDVIEAGNLIRVVAAPGISGTARFVPYVVGE